MNTNNKSLQQARPMRESLIYMMNISGPKIEPCGTPVVIDA